MVGQFERSKSVSDPSLPDFLLRARQVRNGQSELRLHPDDVHILERLLDSRPWPAVPEGKPTIFTGMRVVADSSAERVTAPEKGLLQ